MRHAQLTRRDGRPIGLQSVPDRARAAWRLSLEGKTRAEIAAIYGVSTKAVENWFRAVRAAEEDERNARRNGR